MIFSKISFDNVAYYCLHAEQCLNNLQMEFGVVAMTAAYRTPLDEICDDIQNDHQNTSFILDCENVDNIQINAIEPRLADLVNKQNKTIVFENVKESLIEQLPISSFLEEDNLVNKDEKEKKYSFFSFKKGFDCSLIKSSINAFELTFLENVKLYNQPLLKGNTVHTSSSVLLTSYIDIKKFIVEKRIFMLYAIYRLAMKTKRHWLDQSKTNKKKPVLVCQSLNGSFIASFLSTLLDLDLYILDQVGPVNKLYRAIGAKIESNTDYIVVSDMVCMGTEVKIAKSIVEYLGGNYIGNVTIVRTVSVKEFNNTEEVFVIDEQNCKQLNYKIITALG